MPMEHAARPEPRKQNHKRPNKPVVLHSKTGPRLIQKTRGKKAVVAGSNSQKTIIFAPVAPYLRNLAETLEPITLWNEEEIATTEVTFGAPR